MFGRSIHRFICACLTFAIAAAVGRSASAQEARPAGPARHVSAAELREWLSFLASDEMKGRPTGSPEIDRAADWIAEKYRALELKPVAGMGNHFQNFELAGRGGRGRRGDAGGGAEATPPPPIRARNVLAFLEGSDPALREEYILIGAHYDHIGVRGDAEDNIYNGADDDGSGTVTMLGIAATLQRRRAADPNDAPKRSIVFAAWSAEEMGMRGSRHYATNAPLPLEKMVVNLNLEMLGHTENLGKNQIWITGAEYSDLLDVVAARWTPLGWSVTDCPLGPSFFGRSDNASFAMMRRGTDGAPTIGLPAHSISTWGNERHYHQPNDHADIIDYENMEAIVALLTDSAMEIAGRGAWIEWKPGSGFERYRGGR